MRKHRLPPLRYALLFIAFCLLSAPAQAQKLTVTRVVDGNTFELSDGRTVRLIGIDTPKDVRGQRRSDGTRRPQRDIEALQDLGEQAAEWAEGLVLDRPIELEYEQSNVARDHKDRDGYTLAYVWVLDEKGRRQFMANRRMIRDGYANAYTRQPSRYARDFMEVQHEARKEKRGLWNEVRQRAEPTRRPNTKH